VIETELMPSLVVGDTERSYGKLKRGNSFSKSNFERGPSFTTHAAVSNRFNLGRHKVGAQHYRDIRMTAFTDWSRAVA
jgi:putative transposase